MPPNPLPYRVVQWSTGTVGAHALRAVIEHRRMSLVGVYVRGKDKAARDAMPNVLTDLDPVWDVRETGWHVWVDGDAPWEVTLWMPIPLNRMADVSPAYTANRAVNAVAFVCTAGPGVHATLDLPQVVATLA